MLTVCQIGLTQESCQIKVEIDSLEGKVCFVNSLNDVIATYNVDRECDSQYYNGRFKVLKRNVGRCNICYGCVDTCGKEIVECKYAYLSTKSDTYIPVIFYDSVPESMYLDENGNVVFHVKGWPYDFHDGLARNRGNDKYGYIDEKGDVVIPYVFELAGDFNDGLACVTQNHIDYYINKNGDKTWTSEDILPQKDKEQILNLLLNSLQFNDIYGGGRVSFSNKYLSKSRTSWNIKRNGKLVEIGKRRRKTVKIDLIMTEIDTMSKIYIVANVLNHNVGSEIHAYFEKKEGEWYISHTSISHLGRGK